MNFRSCFITRETDDELHSVTAFGQTAETVCALQARIDTIAQYVFHRPCGISIGVAGHFSEADRIGHGQNSIHLRCYGGTVRP